MASEGSYEVLEKLGEEAEETLKENVFEAVVEVISSTYKKNILSENQVKQLITLYSNANANDKSMYAEILMLSAESERKFRTISKCSEILSGLEDMLGICKDVYSIYTQVRSGDVSGVTVLSEALDALSIGTGWFPGCEAVSSMLSLAKDILDKGSELVNTRKQFYEQLDDILEDVMGGSATSEQETKAKDFYSMMKNYEATDCEEAIDLYNTIMNNASWLFGIYLNTSELNAYQEKLCSLDTIYNYLRNKLQPLETLDKDNDGDLDNDEIQAPKEKIEQSQNAKPVDPLVFDLNRNGKFSEGKEVYFDYSGDGFAEKTAWIESGDGLLAYDKNKNGLIDDGNELFGDKTVMKDGTVATNGFVALSEFDSNGDKKINNEDELFEQLVVWIDNNTDGISQEEELHSLNDLEIEEISLKSESYNTIDENGNIVSRKSIFALKDGTLGEVAELKYNISSMDTLLKEDIEVLDEIKNNYPELIPSGNMLTLHQAMSVDNELYQLVKEFVNNDSMGKLEKLVDQIIVKWTKTEDVVEGSRGGYVDARQLAIVEKFYGKEFVGVSGANPNDAAGALLTEAYYELRNDIFMNLLRQSILSDYCKATVVKEKFITGERRIDYTNVISMFENDFSGDEINTLIKLKYYLQILETNKGTSQVYSIEKYKESLVDSIYESYFVKVPNMSVFSGTDFDDNVMGDSANNFVLAETGNDVVYGEAGDDIIHGGAGNDTLVGGSGADTYVFNLGDGQDVINNYDSSTWKKDKIVFGEGINPEDIELIREGNNLIISNIKSGDKLTVNSAFSDRDGWYYIGSIEFSDGTVWGQAELCANRKYMRGTDVADTLTGFDSGYNNNINEIFDGGAGNDILKGSYGNDTYIFYTGCGNDIIYDYSGTNKMEFGDDIRPEDITVSRSGSYDVVLTIAGCEDSITIQSFMYSSSYRNFTLSFADGRTATFDVTNLCLVYEPAEEPVADLDTLAQENAQSLADIMSEGDVTSDTATAATQADLSLIMSDDASVDASTDTQAGLLAQELSALDTENNVFTSNDVVAVEQTQLFTEQCTVE